MSARWTGPREGQIGSGQNWIADLPIPPECWPYGPPREHEDGCYLKVGGKYCDCAASDASDDDTP